MTLSLMACAGDNSGEKITTTPETSASSTWEGSTSKPPVTTPEQTEPPVTTEPPTKIIKITYILDLGLDKIENGDYKIMGYNLATKKMEALDKTSKATWSPDWPGHFVSNTNYNIANKPEGEGFLDLMATAAYGAAIVFTAPTDGEYTYSGDFNKRYMHVNRENGTLPCRVDITVMKSDGTVIEMKTTVGDKWDEKFSMSGTTELKAGEQLWVIVTRKDPDAGGYNLGLISFKTVAKVEVPA